MSLPNCLTPLLACRLRMAVLATNGAPSAGAGNLWVSDSLIKLSYQLQVETGVTFTQKNGCGTTCVQYEGADRIKSVTLSLELCHLDFEGVALATGASLVSEAGRTNIGTALPSVDADLTRRTSLEIWSLAWDGDEQAVDDTGGSEPLYIRTIFPSVSWVEGDRTYEEGITRIVLNGKGRSNANFGNGPGNDLPWGAYNTPKGEYLDDGELPVATCGTSSLVAS